MARSRPASPSRKRPRFQLRSCARRDDGLADATAAFLGQVRSQLNADLRRARADAHDARDELKKTLRRTEELVAENARLRAQRDGLRTKLDTAEREADTLMSKVRRVEADNRNLYAMKDAKINLLEKYTAKYHALQKENALMIDQNKVAKEEAARWRKAKECAVDGFKQELREKLNCQLANHIRALGGLIGSHFSDSEAGSEEDAPPSQKPAATPPPETSSAQIADASLPRELPEPSAPASSVSELPIAGTPVVYGPAASTEDGQIADASDSDSDYTVSSED